MHDEDMTPEEFDARAAAGESVELTGRPRVVVVPEGFQVMRTTTWGSGTTFKLQHRN